MRYRLGLDVGTNSLGWSVLKVSKDGVPCGLEAAGVRIFADGRNLENKSTLAAKRREVRSARRLRDRFKQRQLFLLDELKKAGLFPQNLEQQKRLQKFDPLELRTKALTEKLEPHEIGRALVHINQRRGFNKSNRKDKSEEIGGKVSDSVRMLLEEMGLIDPPLPPEEYKVLPKKEKKAARQQEAENHKQALKKLASQKHLTYGSFLWQRQKQGFQTRARPRAGDSGKLYDVYPTRELYEDEFNKIWTAQTKHHPALKGIRERIHHVIFTQRPLKPQKRGRCTYMQEEDRTFRAMPSFQRYRIYQEVNALEWQTAEKTHRLKNYPAARNDIVALLERPTTKKGNVTFQNMKKVIKELELAEGDFKFNFETEKRNGFDGNLTSNLMQHEDRIGPEWHDWPLEKQDAFIEAIFAQVPDEKRERAGEMRKQTDGEVRARLIKDFGLDEYAANNCVNARLDDGTANVSLKAARKMLEKMRDGIVNQETGEMTLPIQSDAATAVAKEVPEFIDPMRKRKTDEGEFKPSDHLPYYGQAFQDGRHIIPGDQNPEDKHDDRKYFGGVTNPTVHIALNQIRQVVNELIDRYGHPYSIAIELGRELPIGKEGRNKIEKKQKENQDRNQRLDAQLEEHVKEHKLENPNSRDRPRLRDRLRLWEDLSEDPNGRCCPFSGKKIGRADLFNGHTEIDHLIPFSISLDDSYANKVLCTRQANRDKGQRIPHEAFGNNPDGYNWHDIFERSKNLPKPKQWRFQENALEVWKRDHDDFLARHLNDTRYIGRLTREYLELICHIDKIDVLTGRLTALLRRHWGLNSVLHSNQSTDDDAPKKKNRDDHRHHAVDAIVIGMTSRSMLQKVSTAAERAEELEIDRLFEKDTNGKNPIDPWDGFRDDVKQTISQIIVSHKTNRRKEGQLHKEFAYGILRHTRRKLDTDNINHPIKTEVLIRRPITDFKDKKHVSEIKDGKLREQFLTSFSDAIKNGKKGSDGVSDLAGKIGVRRLRVSLSRTVQPIRDRATGKTYKAFWLKNNWATEIYEYPNGHKKAGQWKYETISRYEVSRPDFKLGITRRPHPAAKLVMRLHAEDFVAIKENGNERFMRVQKMSGGQIYICEHQEANVAERLAELVRNNIAISVSASRLKSLKARKVHISPSGMMSYERRH